MSTIVSGPICATTRRTGVPAEVHAMLVIWGSWRARTANAGPAGYPKQSPFVKSALYGKLGIPQESNVRVDTDVPPPMVDQVERNVLRMPEQLAEALELRYIGVPDRRGTEPIYNAMARAAGVSPSTFRNRLESAQWYLYARLYE